MKDVDETGGSRRVRPAPLEEADEALLRALLDVYAKIDLDDQLRELAAHAAEWSGLRHGLAFVPGETESRFALAAGSFDDDDPRADALRAATVKVRQHLKGSDDRLCEGFPAFLEGADTWAGDRPAVTWTLAIRGGTEEMEGVVLLMGESEPEPAARERVRGLLEGARDAVDNAVRVRGIRSLVFKDDTADCFNRRYFEEFLSDELARASRFRSPLSLIFFDMDNLKEVNSRLGHSMGSRTLFEVSQRVRIKIRKFDKLFRFGGDEFCIVLPETEWHGALEVAERVRESIAGRPFLLEQTGGTGVRMTASFGISSYPLHAHTRESLIQCSDRAMQRIKSGTKNSIAIAEIATPESS